MGRYREPLHDSSKTWPAKVDAGSYLNSYYEKQRNGEVFYGQYFFYPNKRLRRSHASAALLLAQRQIDWQPPIAAIPDPCQFVPAPAPEPAQDEDDSPELELPPFPPSYLGPQPYQPPYMLMQASMPPPRVPREPAAPPKDGRASGKAKADPVAKAAKADPPQGTPQAPPRKQPKEKSKTKADGSSAPKGPKKTARAEDPPGQRPGTAEGGEEASRATPQAAPSASNAASANPAPRSKTGSAGRSKAGTPVPPSQPDEEETVEVDSRCSGKGGGDACVKLLHALPEPPPGNTVMRAHGLASLEGVTFYRAVEVVDPDDPDKLYLFDLKDPMHCPCFNIGVDAEDSTIISWSDLHCLYCLADGTKWAEHGNYHDLEDLDELAKKKGVDIKSKLPRQAGAQELFKRKGRFHSRLQNIEFECWISHGQLPDKGGDADNMYYWTHVFDPADMSITEFK